VCGRIYHKGSELVETLEGAGRHLDAAGNGEGEKAEGVWVRGEAAFQLPHSPQKCTGKFVSC